MLATNPSPYQHSHNYKMAAPTNARDARIAELLSNLDLLNGAPRNNKPFPKPVVYEQEDEAEEDELERTLPGPVDCSDSELSRVPTALAANMPLPADLNDSTDLFLCAEVMAQAAHSDPVELGALVAQAEARLPSRQGRPTPQSAKARAPAPTPPFKPRAPLQPAVVNNAPPPPKPQLVPQQLKPPPMMQQQQQQQRKPPPPMMPPPMQLKEAPKINPPPQRRSLLPRAQARQQAAANQAGSGIDLGRSIEMQEEEARLRASLMRLDNQLEARRCATAASSTASSNNFEPPPNYHYEPPPQLQLLHQHQQQQHYNDYPLRPPSSRCSSAASGSGLRAVRAESAPASRVASRLRLATASAVCEGFDAVPCRAHGLVPCKLCAAAACRPAKPKPKASALPPTKPPPRRVQSAGGERSYASMRVTRDVHAGRVAANLVAEERASLMAEEEEELAPRSRLRLRNEPPSRQKAPPPQLEPLPPPPPQQQPLPPQQPQPQQMDYEQQPQQMDYEMQQQQQMAAFYYQQAQQQHLQYWQQQQQQMMAPPPVQQMAPVAQQAPPPKPVTRPPPMPEDSKCVEEESGRMMVSQRARALLFG